MGIITMSEFKELMVPACYVGKGSWEAYLKHLNREIELHNRLLKMECENEELRPELQQLKQQDKQNMSLLDLATRAFKLRQKI